MQWEAVFLSFGPATAGFGSVTASCFVLKLLTALELGRVVFVVGRKQA